MGDLWRWLWRGIPEYLVCLVAARLRGCPYNLEPSPWLLSRSSEEFGYGDPLSASN